MKTVTLFCPKCGEEIEVAFNNYLVESTTTSLTIKFTTSVVHTCDYEQKMIGTKDEKNLTPDTYRLQPIDKFLRTGDLNDLNPCICPGSAYRYSGSLHTVECPWYALPDHRTP